MKLSDIKLGVIGLGYVGLPLAVEFAKHRRVVGFDVSEKRIGELVNGIDVTLEVASQDLLEATQLLFSSAVEDLKDCNVYIVTVPTPIDENNAPDLEPLKAASSMLAGVLEKNDIVVYESTVYPGATEEVCVPVLESGSGLRFNLDFFAG